MSGYRKVRIGNTSWWLRPDVSPAQRPLLDALLADPESTLLGPSSVARPRMGRKRFYRLAVSGAPALFVKVFGPPEGALAWLGPLRGSHARREAAVAAAIARRGFAAAVPIAFGERWSGLRLADSFSVVSELPARDLRSVLLERTLSGLRRRAALERYGELQRRLHDAGIDQDDTSPNNFLIDAEGAFTLIDFERCRVGPALGARRWRLLAKLQRHRLGVSRTDRLRFLRGYLGAGSDAAARREAWERIRAELRRVRRHDARRAARAAFKEGRQLLRSGASWIARGRESLPVARFALGTREARHVWVLGHQLERLGLPALRPARLDPDGVALVLPEPHGTPAPDQIARARRELESFGRFVRPPEWELGADGALLRDLRAFELDF
jgi:tRNA A-37 threonylcarbamoyl transferase component Bud32